MGENIFLNCSGWRLQGQALHESRVVGSGGPVKKGLRRRLRRRWWWLIILRDYDIICSGFFSSFLRSERFRSHFSQSGFSFGITLFLCFRWGRSKLRNYYVITMTHSWILPRCRFRLWGDFLRFCYRCFFFFDFLKIFTSIFEKFWKKIRRNSRELSEIGTSCSS